MTEIVKRIALSVLLLAVVGVVGCGSDEPAQPAVQVPGATKAQPTQEVQPELRGTFARRIAAAHALRERQFAEGREKASRGLEAAARRVTDLEEAIARQPENEGKLRHRLEQARAELERAEFMNRWFHEGRLGHRSGQPCHAGNVVRVNHDHGVYWISLGRADGVRPGFLYHVARDGDYIHTVRIYEVMDRQSAGCVVAQLPGGQVKLGDKVLND